MQRRVRGWDKISMLKHFYGSIAFTILCLGLGSWYGYTSGGSVGAALSVLWICIVLGVLEVSLSFDNAVVNATVLKDMDPVWQRRFLTWGILIAVFGMRVVFPILIVAIAGQLGPVAAVSLALNDPDRYAAIVSEAHIGIMGFGGAFLMLVGLKFFFNAEKEHDWIGLVEAPLRKVAGLDAVEIIVVLLALFGVSTQLAVADAHVFMVSGIMGIVVYFAVQWMGHVLGAPEGAVEGVQRSGLAAFLYLEVLDASFSFDGVIGAFALTTNLVIIALGLGIGAMFVRSITIALVRQGTLGQFRFLEHGAFWAILALASIMFASVLVHIPEAVTGLVGAGLIGLSVWSSVRHNRADRALLEAGDAVALQTGRTSADGHAALADVGKK
ncbi:hypothetical protein GCM10007973_20690 [Polymorphobacter multimanifer]|nr:hypothetical protein GCM10007973_20690 [Polymorphobacter multimanifer]